MLAICLMWFSPCLLADEPAFRSGWRIQIVAESVRFRDEDNYLGALPWASEGLDEFDIEEQVPYTRDYLSLVFTNPALPKVPWGYSSDYRALLTGSVREWPFTVRASAGIDYVTLTWTGARQQFRAGWLIDQETGTYIRALPGGSYSYPRGENDRNFIFAIYLQHPSY